MDGARASGVVVSLAFLITACSSGPSIDPNDFACEQGGACHDGGEARERRDGTAVADAGASTVDGGARVDAGAVDAAAPTDDGGGSIGDGGATDAQDPVDGGLLDGQPAAEDAATGDGGRADAEPIDASRLSDGGAATDGGGADAQPLDGATSTDGSATADVGGADAQPADAGLLDAGAPTPDTDGDSISDVEEGSGLVDTDRDGVPDTLDLDSDNDGIPDSAEAGDMSTATPAADSDGDGTADYRDPDSDDDGIDDSVEGPADPDNDGLGNWVDPDADGDSISDADETIDDHDGDGTPSYLDLDADDDTIGDALEAGDANVSTRPIDNDFDGAADFIDTDSDNDSISDRDEGLVDTDNDTIVDRLDIDSDNDALLDTLEAGDTSTVTAPIDSDNDGTPDFRDLDSDDDTIADIAEGAADLDLDMIPNYRDTDTDADTVPDAIEAGDTDLATPAVDTDMDGDADYLDFDSDGDGLADSREAGCPASTDRLRADSDSDTYGDTAELAYGSDPCSAFSLIDDVYFVLPPGGPASAGALTFTDTNLDRLDLALSMDTTGSMQDEITNLRTTLSTSIIPGVGASVRDAAVAVTSFQDFPVAPFGRAGADLPFQLLSRVSTNSATAQAAANTLVVADGEDLAESGLEALFQISTGAGASWAGGSVPPFNPISNRVPGVADGTIGGVGFRSDALPTIVHITDAASHTAPDYQATSASIGAASIPDVQNALSQIGARVVTVVNSRVAAIGPEPTTPICDGTSDRVLGGISVPPGSDTDWLLLEGAQPGAIIRAEIWASRLGSPIDPVIAIYDATGQIAINDDITTSVTDSRIVLTLTGTAPYHLAITTCCDTDFDAVGSRTTGWWFADISVDGQPYTTADRGCRADDGDDRSTATRLVPAAMAMGPPSVESCKLGCSDVLPEMTTPHGMSSATGAEAPTCAWDYFSGRPSGCAAGECCTGLDGAGVPPTSAGQCPLTFEIDDQGANLDQAVISAVTVLTQFAPFTITTVVRPDPAELMGTGLDTTCFIHGVVPQTAIPPNSCASNPTAVDLVPPTPALDSWEGVSPGTVLAFEVQSSNQDANTGTPCVAAAPQPQLFRAFIDLLADGVTVVDTKEVLVIVPPPPPGLGD